MIPLLIIALCIWWFVLQFQDQHAAKWDRRKQAMVFIGRYLRTDWNALWHKRDKGPSFYEE